MKAIAFADSIARLGRSVAVTLVVTTRDLPLTDVVIPQMMGRDLVEGIRASAQRTGTNTLGCRQS